MLLSLLDDSARFKQVLSALGRRVDMPLYAAGLSGVHKALLAAATAEKTGRSVLIVTPDEASATRIAEDMAQVMGADRVALLPARDLALRSVEGASREFEHARLRVLGRLLTGECRAVTCSVARLTIWDTVGLVG